MDKDIVRLSDVKTERKYKWQQSANALFNFMREIEYLKTALKNMAIIPRYYSEYVEYLKIINLKKISYPMTCFCDIPINKLSGHMNYYGGYGIGLDKENWGLKKGLQPIKYVNEDSPLLKDFVDVFKKVYLQEVKVPPNCEFLMDYLITDLVYTKPIKGVMEKEKEETTRLFQDECEWRYVPKLPEDLDIPLILPQSVTNTTKGYNLNSYSDVLKIHKECWLTFNLENIKYIVVPNDIANKEMISFILRDMKNIEDDEKYLLISKIFVMEQLQEDI